MKLQTFKFSEQLECQLVENKAKAVIESKN